jgi:hypothetical protein
MGGVCTCDSSASPPAAHHRPRERPARIAASRCVKPAPRQTSVFDAVQQLVHNLGGFWRVFSEHGQRTAPVQTAICRLQPVHRIHLSIEGFTRMGDDLGPPRSAAQFLPAGQMLGGRSLEDPADSCLCTLYRAGHGVPSTSLMRLVSCRGLRRMQVRKLCQKTIARHHGWMPGY